jgi:hypothetical protein
MSNVILFTHFRLVNMAFLSSGRATFTIGGDTPKDLKKKNKKKKKNSPTLCTPKKKKNKTKQKKKNKKQNFLLMNLTTFFLP